MKSDEELREAVRNDEELMSQTKRLHEMFAGGGSLSEEELDKLFKFFRGRAEELSDRFPELREYGP